MEQVAKAYHWLFHGLLGLVQVLIVKKMKVNFFFKTNFGIFSSVFVWLFGRVCIERLIFLIE